MVAQHLHSKYFSVLVYMKQNLLSTRNPATTSLGYIQQEQSIYRKSLGSAA